MVALMKRWHTFKCGGQRNAAWGALVAFIIFFSVDLTHLHWWMSHVLLRSSLKDERNNWQQIITVIITSLRCTGSACCSVSRNVVVISELSLMTKFLTYQLIYIIPTLTCGHGLWVVTERMRLRVWTAEKGFFLAWENQAEVGEASY